MSAMSNYLENKLGDAILRGIAFTMPTTLYVRLFEAATDDAAAGTEATYAGYAAVALTAAAATWKGTHDSVTGPSTGTNGLFVNAADIVFPTPTANGNPIVAVGIYDAATGGNRLFHGALTAQQSVVSGTAPKFTAGQLTLTLA